MSDGKPVGGKYSYDKYNRQSIPGKDFDGFIKENKIKYEQKKYRNEYYTEAIAYCENTFTNYYPENYCPDNIYYYPVTFSDSKKHFKAFIKNKLDYFGMYQDAVDFNQPFMFHSVISPQLNNGLLVPSWCLELILDAYEDKNLHSIEGFIRQLNWREYSRLLYRYAYDKMRKNYFGNKRHLNENWYKGTTGIEPIDLAIKQAFQYGYLHHIIRLMIMCNFMNLCKIHPDDVYRWFMEFSLDSYDWVMINNVYSMGMHADGGVTTTKPYISSSNYVVKESNSKKDGYWNIVWNILYYNFIGTNLKKFTGRSIIYRYQWQKLADKKSVMKSAKKYISDLTSTKNSY